MTLAIHAVNILEPLSSDRRKKVCVRVALWQGTRNKATAGRYAPDNEST